MEIKVRKIKLTTEDTKKKPAKKNGKENSLPPDTYKDEVEPITIPLDEDGNNLVLSVKRGGDLGLPRVDVRHYIKTERYTGFTRKGINIPIEVLQDLIDGLEDLSDECEEKEI